MIHTILLSAFLAAYAGDVTSTCQNLAHGQREHNPLVANHGCRDITTRSVVGMGLTTAVVSEPGAPMWARIAVYGTLAATHGYALAHNLKHR